MIGPQYDVVGGGPDSPLAAPAVQMITSRFSVREMAVECDIRARPTCWGSLANHTGINLIYAAGHCHAPSCIRQAQGWITK